MMRYGYVARKWDLLLYLVALFAAVVSLLGRKSQSVEEATGLCTAREMRTVYSTQTYRQYYRDYYRCGFLWCCICSRMRLVTKSRLISSTQYYSMTVCCSGYTRTEETCLYTARTPVVSTESLTPPSTSMLADSSNIAETPATATPTNTSSNVLIIMRDSSPNNAFSQQQMTAASMNSSTLGGGFPSRDNSKTSSAVVIGLGSFVLVLAALVLISCIGLVVISHYKCKKKDITKQATESSMNKNDSIIERKPLPIANILYSIMEENGRGNGNGVNGGECTYEDVDTDDVSEFVLASDKTVYADAGPNNYEEFQKEVILDNNYMAPALEENELYAQLDTIGTNNLLRDHIKVGHQLGCGQFGAVHKGELETMEGAVSVAVKTLKEGSTNEDRVKFLQEAAIMGQFKHSNVINLYGFVTEGKPLLLVLELLKGDLRNYLLNSRSEEDGLPLLESHMLLSFCRHVAEGMAYLSGKGFVHRDLAARNILVSEDNICKIADFGMSRDLMCESYYISKGGMIPIKWTSPEALLYKKYSTASDVWSYGIVMFEIWSVGHKPYVSITSNNALIEALDSGYRAPPPPGCSRRLYSIMIDCWHPKTSKRPTFKDLVRKLSIPDAQLLGTSMEDEAVNPDASKLGGNLQASQDLYKDLQMIYQST